MPCRVLLTRYSANELKELDSWIATHDSPERTDYVVDRISEVLRKLADLPERGTYPKELSDLGIREFREVFFKPYRIIYRVEDRTGYVYLFQRSNLQGGCHYAQPAFTRANCPVACTKQVRRQQHAAPPLPIPPSSTSRDKCGVTPIYPAPISSPRPRSLPPENVASQARL